MNKDIKFWDKISGKYYRKPISDPGAYQHKLEMTREFLKPHMQALEIGCGTGGTAILHAPYVKHILATDISPKMIEIAKTRPEIQGVDNVMFTAASLDELNVRDQEMDVVFTLSLLHLLKRPGEAVERIYKMLSPGGLFVSSTTCIADVMPVFRWIGPIAYRLGFAPFVNVFSSNELEAFIRNAGFDIEYQWQRTNKKEGKDTAFFIIAVKP